MEQVIATRSELLARRTRIALASQGRDVLKEKRDSLMEEFRSTVNRAVTGRNALQEAAVEGRLALAAAEACDGPDAVRSAALAQPGEISLTTRETSVMGVRIADIQHEPVGRPRSARGFSFAGSSPTLDRVAETHEAELALLLDTAAVELRLRRIADEIGTTTRRINALESVVLPTLEREHHQITSILDERERQDRFRLKRFATRRAQRGEAGEEPR